MSPEEMLEKYERLVWYARSDLGWGMEEDREVADEIFPCLDT